MKNSKALADFFEENRRRLFGYLVKTTGNYHDAEEIFQETFIKYATKYPDEKSRALLFTIARNIFLDCVRKAVQTDGTDEPVQLHTAEDELINKETTTRISALLDKLPPEDRELLSMAGEDGLRYSEIAEITGLSEANVKVRIHRARAKLKSMIGADDE